MGASFLDFFVVVVDLDLEELALSLAIYISRYGTMGRRGREENREEKGREKIPSSSTFFFLGTP